jgi:predicted aminopeptidase
MSEVISASQTNQATRQRLMLAEDIKAYAIQELGLEGSDNYTTFSDIGNGPVVWALTVCEKDRLDPHRWSYPVIGSAPYRGFFDRERGERERKRYDLLGFDTHLRGVSAFSTLGWFRDPLLSSMLNYPAIDLADVIIHELTHATIWIENDADFNESLATFVGREGAKQWARTEFPSGVDSLATRERGRRDRVKYRTLMHSLASRLDSIYSLDILRSDKLALKGLEVARIREDAEIRDWETAHYRDPKSWKINNATLSLFRTYYQKTDVFDRVLEMTGGLKSAMVIFERCEEQKDPEAYLENWLEDQEASK